MKSKLTNLVWWTLLFTVGAIGSSGLTVGQERQADAGFDFKGRMLVSVSDADMVDSTYIDGNLGSVDGRDALSVIRLDKPSRKLRAVEVGVSNSVTGPPDSIAVTPDGKYAIVIETRKQRPAGKLDLKLSDLAVGRTITVVDLSNPDRQRVVQRIESFRQPTSIAINPQGSLVAVSFDPRGDGKQMPLAFYRFRGGKLSTPLTPQIPGWTVGDALLNVEFHPQEPILSLVNLTKPNLSFVRFTDVGSAINLTRWGNRLALRADRL